MPPIPEEKEELFDEEIPATPNREHEEEIPPTQLDTLSPARMTPASTRARSPAPKIPEACPKTKPKDQTRAAAKKKANPKSKAAAKNKASPKSKAAAKKKANPNKTGKATAKKKASPKKCNKDDPLAMEKKLASALWLQKLSKTKVDKDADAHLSFSEWRADF